MMETNTTTMQGTRTGEVTLTNEVTTTRATKKSLYHNANMLTHAPYALSADKTGATYVIANVMSGVTNNAFVVSGVNVHVAAAAARVSKRQT